MLYVSHIINSQFVSFTCTIAVMLIYAYTNEIVTSKEIDLFKTIN